MPVLVSPGVLTLENDLTTAVPAVDTTEGALAGVFRWGPIDKAIPIDSEINLVKRYGYPTNLNPETWFTAASFLGYSNRLYISRAADVTGNTVTRSYTGNATSLAIEIDTNDLTLSNTDNLSAGMVLLHSNNAALPVGTKIAAVTNGTSLSLDNTASANIESIEVIFREDVVYTAAALQSDLNYDVSDVSDWDSLVVKNEDHYETIPNFDSAALYVAKYPGESGNSLRVAVCDSPSQFASAANLYPNAHFSNTDSRLVGNVGSNTLTISVAPADTANTTMIDSANLHAAAIYATISVGDLIEVGNTRIGYQMLKVTDIGLLSSAGNVYSFSVQVDDELKLSSDVSLGHVNRYWEFYNAVDIAPGQSDYVLQYGNNAANDELHVVVVDEAGKFSTSPGTILEVHKNLSRATDAKSPEGESIYYKNVVNQRSEYIWYTNDRTTARSNTANFITSSIATVPLNMVMVGGSDGPGEGTVAFSSLAFAYDLFKSDEELPDISLVMQGKARGLPVTNYSQLANYIIDNITEHRKDCVAFISPDINDVVHNIGGEALDIVQFRGTCRNSSYAFLDSGYKYMYDKYNNVYRWVPLNGDMAGLCARTDATNDAWWSPAGLNRGHLKNVVRLAYNPKQSDRDILYKSDINPVISQAGKGTFLYGDKTLLGKPSAFDRLNVRRLFIVLRKASKRAAQYILFEFNDDYTRAQFRNMINPYLRDVKGRRGIYDYLVICDTRNNTPVVIDRNEFVADILVKPARSINFIILTFHATPTGLSFTEAIRF